MKTNFIAAVLFLATSFANAQVLGNAGYANRNISNYENNNPSPMKQAIFRTSLRKFNVSFHNGYDSTQHT